MLRLERTSPFRTEVAIRFRSRERLFSRPFITGLAIAAVAHTLFLLCVHFEPYHASSGWVHPPTAVTIDLGPSMQADEAIASTQIDAQGLLPRYVVEPEASRPELPHLAPQPIAWEAPRSSRALASGRAFAQMERLPYRLFEAKPTLRTLYSPIRIDLSGPLAEHTVSHWGLKKWETKVTGSEKRKRFATTFEVRLEERTGRLFWIRQIRSTGMESLDQRARKLLHHIRFVPRPQGISTSGQIEIAFEVERGDPLHLLSEEERVQN